MADQKTKPTNQSVEQFINTVENEKIRNDCFKLITIMKDITNCEPTMWGGTIIGFDKYHYKYDSGREGDACLIGFSPRKQNISIYLMSGFESDNSLLERLGKHKAGKGCLYIKKLDDVKIEVLEELIKRSVQFLRAKFS